MKSAEEIYRRSLALMGEEENGENASLRLRAVALINVLLSQLFELELALGGKRAEDGQIIPQIRELEEEIPFSEPILYTVIPLGLAGFLLNEEEPERGKFFLQLYHTEMEILRSRAKRGLRHKIRRSV